jgi:RNA polymerase sigma factor (sigma-70 family)
MPQSDSELVAACRRGDARAWEALVLRYQRLIYTIPLRAGLDEAQAADILQRVFAKLVEALPRIEQLDRIQPWLVTTTKRETHRQQQQQARTQPLVAEEDDDGR